MKKLMMSLAAVALMSTSAMAITGTINSILVKSDGTVKIRIEENGSFRERALDSTNAEAKKILLTVALTAKSTGATVAALGDGNGWHTIQLK